MEQTLLNLNRFYSDFVNNSALGMNATDEIRRMIEIVREEQARAHYYIHTEQNRRVYFRNLNESLIKLKIEARIRKDEGFKRYLQQYDQKKQDFTREIKDLWFIYSRIPE